MIIRTWHGWTAHQYADAYEELLQEEIFVGITARNIHGLRDIKLLCRQLEAKVEFITIMSFASIASETRKAFYGQAIGECFHYLWIPPHTAKQIVVRNLF